LGSTPDSLHELLQRWRHPPPDSIDIDLNTVPISSDRSA
jgi:hypothetical protein